MNDAFAVVFTQICRIKSILKLNQIAIRVNLIENQSW